MIKSFEREKPPRYLQIALDFANKIVEKHYQVGERVFIRSALAAQYNVSSETARRAMSILKENGVIEVEQGSGILILSSENAVAFLNDYQSLKSLDELSQDITHNLLTLETLTKTIKEQLDALMDKTNRFKDSGPFVPYEVIVPSKEALHNKTLQDIKFWQETEATVIAIKQNGKLVFSPGPKTVFNPGDVFYFVGEKECYNRVKEFLNSF